MGMYVTYMAKQLRVSSYRIALQTADLDGNNSRIVFKKGEIMPFGWTGNILRVDLSSKKVSIEPTEPYTRSFIGGRGISVKMLFDEVGPKVGAYDPENRLFFGPGVLTGTPAVGSSRLKVTAVGAGGYLRHSGIGGDVPNALKWAGYDLLVIQGKLDKPGYIYINNDTVEFKDASHIWGKATNETSQMVQNEVGKQTPVLCIGLGGENQVSYGSIRSGWGDSASRCGMGGVMGSKNLKAIAVTGSLGVKIARPEEFLKAAEEQIKAYAANENSKFLLYEATKDIAFGWDYFGIGVRGNYEACDWNQLKIGHVNEFYDKHVCHPNVCGSCTLNHFVTYDVPGVGKGGMNNCTGLYSVIGTIWNNDYKLAFQAFNLINNYGMDVMSVGNIIAFLMELYEKGIITEKDTDGIPMKKGDANAIISTIHKLARQEGFGKLFKDGVAAGAGKIGRGAEEYAMSIKGLEPQPMEYRYMKPQALASATNTRDFIDSPCDLSYGWAQSPPPVQEQLELLAEKIYGTRDAAKPDKYGAAAPVVVDFENKVAAGDMVGICKFLVPMMFSFFLDVPANIVSLATGVEISEADLMTAAQREITLERAHSVMRGMRRKDDTLPKRLFEEPVPGGTHKGDRLEKAKFDAMLDHYYSVHGYDENGVPKEETFKKFGLREEWKVFKAKVPEAR